VTSAISTTEHFVLTEAKNKMRIKWVRLFSDASGESHFADIEEQLNLIDFAPPAAPLYLSKIFPAAETAFFGAPAGWIADWHVSSARNLFVVLSGEWEVTASDGETRRFGPGSLLLAEDTTGKGHASRVVSNEDSLAVLVRLGQL
jgi:hypothetical protein